jgi:hypothetical protein
LEAFSSIDIPQAHTLLITATAEKLTLWAKANGVEAIAIYLPVVQQLSLADIP